MALKSIVIESFDSHGKPCTRFNGRVAILVDPTLENTAKATLTEETVGPEIPCGQLQFVVGELS